MPLWMSGWPTRSLRTVIGACCVLALALAYAPAAAAAPQLDVSATSGLTDGQTITVEGSGFAADLKGIAVGQCRTGFEGPADCNLAGGATFRNADGSGSIDTVTIRLATTFNGIDCTTEECVIGAGPLPNANSAAVVAANTVVVPLTFGAPPAADPSPSAQPTEQPTAQPSDPPPADPPPADPPPAETTGAGSGLPQTGWREELVVVLLAGTALALPAIGLLLVVSGRRRMA